MRHNIEFQQLEQFVTIARTKNFTRAAEELNLSQSALSRSIQKLEGELNQPLFERKPREVVLTDLGELLLDRAREILQLVEDSFSMLSEADRKGTIRLGAIPTIAPYLLPPLLSSFSEQHPNISVIVQEDTTDNLIKRCSHGDIDFVLLALPISAKYLEVEALFKEELMLVTPATHPLVDQEEITAQSLEPYPFVMLNEAHCLSGNVTSFCRQQSMQPITIERINQLTTVQELVALGHGISIIPEMARRVDASDRRIYRSFTQNQPTRTIAMMWNPYRYQSKWLKTFRDHLRQSYQQPI